MSELRLIRGEWPETERAIDGAMRRAARSRIGELVTDPLLRRYLTAVVNRAFAEDPELYRDAVLRPRLVMALRARRAALER